MKNKSTAEVVKMNPTLYLNDKEYPEIKEWEVEDEYTLIVKVKVLGKNIHTYEDKKSTSVDVEIKDFKTFDGSVSTKDFKTFEKKYGAKEK